MRAQTSATAMRRLTHTRSDRRRRGATMMEFVLILPVLLFVTLFTIDMGNVILTNGAMQDAAYSAARSGAQLGGGGLDPATGKITCALNTQCRNGVAYDSFASTMQYVPGHSNQVFTEPRMTLVAGAKCSAGNYQTSSTPNNHVIVKVTYKQKMLTPGLTWLMQWTGSSVDSGVWNMSVTAVSRCEVVR